MSKKMSFLKGSKKENKSQSNNIDSPIITPEPIPTKKLKNLSKKLSHTQKQSDIMLYQLPEKDRFPEQEPISETSKQIWDDFKQLSLLDPLRHGGGMGTTNNNTYNTYTSADMYHSTLYVSPDGDNSDGSTWAKAYTSLSTALNSVSSDINDYTLVYIAPATYDINMTGDPTFPGNVCLYGTNRYNTIVQNNHASATSVLKFTGITELHNFTIDCGTSNNGIIFDGKDGHKLFEITGLADQATTNLIILTVKDSDYFYMEDSVFAGDLGQQYVTIHKSDGSSRCKVVNTRYYFGDKAIEMENTQSYNYYSNCIIQQCNTGMNICSTCDHTSIFAMQIHNVTTHYVDNGTNTVYNELIDNENATRIHFVSKQGDNSNGHNWDTAFSSLHKALLDASATTTFGLSKLIIAPGEYDLATTNNLYTGSFILEGLSEHSVVITNSATTDKIIGFNSSAFEAYNICLRPSIAQNGIELAVTQDGIILDTFHVDGSNITSISSLIKINSGSFGRFKSITLEGNSTTQWATGIEINSLSQSRFDDCRIGFMHKGIHIKSGNGNVFIGPLRFNQNNTAIEINSGVQNTKLVDLTLNENTINIEDNGTNTYYDRSKITLDREVALLYPTAVNAGVQITTGTAGVWGNYAEIDDGTNFTKPFKIVNIGVGDTSATDDYYFVELAQGSAGSESTLSQTSFGGARFASPYVRLNTGWLSAGTRISARGQSSSGSDTFNIWIEYVEI